jgi:hypothetical protein
MELENSRGIPACGLCQAQTSNTKSSALHALNILNILGCTPLVLLDMFRPLGAGQGIEPASREGVWASENQSVVSYEQEV